MNRKDRAEQENLARLLSASKAFLARVEELGKHLGEQQSFLDAHGQYWTHGDWCKEMDALKQAIREIEKL